MSQNLCLPERLNFYGSVLKLVEPDSWQKYIYVNCFGGGSSRVKEKIKLFIIRVCFIFSKLAVGQKSLCFNEAAVVRKVVYLSSVYITKIH